MFSSQHTWNYFFSDTGISPIKSDQNHEILEKHIKNQEISKIVALLKGVMKGLPVYENFDFQVCFRRNSPHNVAEI